MRTSLTSMLLLLAASAAAGQPLVERSGARYDFDLAGKTIAMVVGPGYEHNEATEAPAHWRAWGARVVVVGTAPVLDGHEIVIDRRGIAFAPRQLSADLLLADFDPTTADAIYFPGGESPAALLRDHRAVVLDLVRRADAAGRLLSGICHGPLVLLAADVARGRRIAGELSEEEARAGGATLVREIAVADGRLVTGNYPFVETFAIRVALALAGREPAPAAATWPFAIGSPGRFLPDEVPDHVLAELVQAAATTPSEMPINSFKPWRVIAVKSPAAREKIKASLTQRLRAFYVAHGIGDERRLASIERVLDAPAYLVVTMPLALLDPRIGAWDAPRELALRSQTLSAGAFTASLRIAAERLGLGTNLVNGLPFLLAEAELARTLDLGADTFIAAVLEIGVPRYTTLPQPRRPASEQLSIL